MNSPSTGGIPPTYSEQICLSTLVIFYDTTEDILTDRLIERGKTSGREDDNIESIRKRLRTYKEETMPVIRYYQSQNKVAEVSYLSVLDRNTISLTQRAD